MIPLVGSQIKARSAKGERGCGEGEDGDGGGGAPETMRPKRFSEVLKFNQFTVLSSITIKRKRVSNTCFSFAICPVCNAVIFFILCLFVFCIFLDC